MSATLAPERILKEMAEIWGQFAKQPDGDAGAGVLRSCSMNLVVIAQEGEDAMSLGETIAALMPEHPARTIVIWPRRNEQLSARVTAQCWMPFGQRRQICCEQIEITAPEGSMPDVASVISPISAPDLPLVVWCRSRPSVESAGCSDLFRMAEKLIVDTADWPDPQASIQRLAALAGGGLVLGDLSWTRLTRWREMFSQLFENRNYAARLPEISRVRVTYGGRNRTVAARYMGAWLGNALETADVRVEVSLEQDAKAPAGHFSAVELGGGGFRVELARQGELLVTTVDGLSQCNSLPAATDYLLMREELGIMRRDEIFERALASAARL
ncbi:MAG TPA: glucose-6-phosphate dehydrogenase assembly protein OpcA [Bryobacteraceae bacterium]|nr:glucose-6-phosphate dehydrogenase assembly protein OpcA [Bryobacteraceae bacterium]